MREDYSEGGDAWNDFTHDQARSRAYRWGEDGLAGISDGRQRLCFALALRLLIAVNYADNQSQCLVRLPFADLGGKTWRLRDLLGPAAYDRDGDSLEARGLFLDMRPMSYHAFEISRTC